MKSDESLLGSLWRVTRSHLERTYIGENSRMNGDPDFEFFSRDYTHSCGGFRYDLENLSRKKLKIQSRSLFFLG